MDNVLIDERRIHVDFSQSVAKMRWKGKGNDTTSQPAVVITVLLRTFSNKELEGLMLHEPK